MLEAGRLTLTKTVDVKNGYKVVQLVVGRKRQGLPNATLSRFTVTDYAVDAVLRLVNVLAGVGHASSIAQTLTKGTRSHINKVEAL